MGLLCVAVVICLALRFAICSLLPFNGLAAVMVLLRAVRIHEWIALTQFLDCFLEGLEEMN